MEEYTFLILPAIIGGIVLQVLIFIAENEDEIACNIINTTLSPRMFIMNCLRLVRNLGIITLGLYLIIQYTWVVIATIAVCILFAIVISAIVVGFSYLSREKKDCTTILRLIQLGNYEFAENILKDERGSNISVGKLRTPLLNLISPLKKKEGKRKPKVWNIHIYDPIQPNKALVPISHYQMESNEK